MNYVIVTSIIAFTVTFITYFYLTHRYFLSVSLSYSHSHSLAAYLCIYISLCVSLFLTLILTVSLHLSPSLPLFSSLTFSLSFFLILILYINFRVMIPIPHNISQFFLLITKFSITFNFNSIDYDFNLRYMI